MILPSSIPRFYVLWLEFRQPLLWFWRTWTDLLEGLVFRAVPIDEVTRLAVVEGTRVDVPVDKFHRVSTFLAV